MESDEQLMQRYQRGQVAAFDQLYARHKGPLYRYLLRQTGGQAFAEELFQDVWVRLINSRARYVPSARFSTFLYSVAHNRVVDFYRSQGRADFDSLQENEALADSLSDDAPGPAQQAERTQLAQQLLAALQALPAAQREAFLLREEAGFSLDEIAEATGVSAETAKSRLRYAVAKLRVALQGVT